MPPPQKYIRQEKEKPFLFRGIPSTKKKMVEPQAGFSVAANMVDFMKDKVAFASK